MNEARPPLEVRALLDATRDDYAPSADVRERVQRRLRARLAVEHGGRSGGFTRAAWRWKWAGAVLLGSAAAAAAIWGDRWIEPTNDATTSDATTRPPASTPSPGSRAGDATQPDAAHPNTATDAGEATRDDESNAPPPAPSGATRAAPPRAESIASRATNQLEKEKAQGLREELEALRRANSLRQSGDPTGALATLDEFERAHPKGVLLQERAAARIFALCAAGRPGEARTRAERFAALFPKSPHLPRVQRACGAP